MTISVLSMNPIGGSSYTANLGDSVLVIAIKYNYTAECWLMDIYDTLEELIIAGIMLVPNIDLLAPYNHIKDSIGTFVLYELKENDYKSSDLFSINTRLVWYSNDETLILS